MRLDYRTLEEPAALEACVALEAEVWGLPERELLPASQLVASVHAGGVVIGAFDGREMAGFVYGFPAHAPEDPKPLGHHSHMLAVLPGHRGRGVGRTLKWRQRAWCLARGVSWMTWTFDPLQARNARLNLEHLGAAVRDYRVNAYGLMGGTLNGDLPSDRVLAHWDLNDARVLRLAAGESPAPLEDCEALPKRLERGGAGQPLLRPPMDAPRLLVELPFHLTELLAADPALALAWRLALREALLGALGGGYRVRRFVGSAYLLERPDLE